MIVELLCGFKIVELLCGLKIVELLAGFKNLIYFGLEMRSSFPNGFHRKPPLLTFSADIYVG